MSMHDLIQWDGRNERYILKEEGETFLLQIGFFSFLTEVKNFLETLQKEFSLTRFRPILESLDPADYSTDFIIRLVEEGSYGCKSEISFQLSTDFSWDREGERFSGDLLFDWNTSSGHRIIILGEIRGDRHENYPGAFYVFRGRDESENFYRGIEAILAEMEESA